MIGRKVALRALVWFLSSVNQGVLIQITLPKKGLLAQLTFMSFVSAVKQFVTVEVSFVRKCLWAFVTSIVKCHLGSEFQRLFFKLNVVQKSKHYENSQ